MFNWAIIFHLIELSGNEGESRRKQSCESSAEFSEIKTFLKIHWKALNLFVSPKENLKALLKGENDSRNGKNGKIIWFNYKSQRCLTNRITMFYCLPINFERMEEKQTEEESQRLFVVRSTFDIGDKVCWKSFDIVLKSLSFWLDSCNLKAILLNALSFIGTATFELLWKGNGVQINFYNRAYELAAYNKSGS